MKILTLKDFIYEYNLKNEATSYIKKQQILSALSSNDVGIYSRDGPFKFDVGIVNLHPFRGTLWVFYSNENYFDSYSCVCPKKLSQFIKKRNGYCLDSEYKIQGRTNKRDSYCASYCLHIIYLTKVIGIDFQYSILNWYYQKIS